MAMTMSSSGFNCTQRLSDQMFNMDSKPVLMIGHFDQILIKNKVAMSNANFHARFRGTFRRSRVRQLVTTNSDLAHSEITLDFMPA